MRIRTVAAVAVFTLVPAALAAQGPPRLGGQISFAEDENAGLGLRLEQRLMPAGVQDLRLMVDFDYFFPSSPFNYWELNADLGWGFALARSPIGMYVGGGLNMARSSVSGVRSSSVSEVGVNVIFGLRFPTATAFAPYVELRPELGGGNRLVLTAGIMF